VIRWALGVMSAVIALSNTVGGAWTLESPGE